MGLFKSIGDVFRGKTPGFLKPVLGDSWMDEAGGVGGFVAGGPAGAGAGAAAGRAAYGALNGEDALSILKGAAGTGLKSAGIAYGGQALLGGGGAAGAGGVVRDANGMIVSKVAPRGGQSLFSTIGSRLQGGDALGALRTLGGGALDWAKKNPEMVLAGMAAAQGARQDTRQNRIEDDYLERKNRVSDLVFQKLSERDMSGGSRPNLVGITTDPGNAFSRRAA